MQKIFKIPLFFTLSWLSPLWMRHGLSYSPVMYHICTKCDSSDAEVFSQNHKMSKVNKESDKSSTASYREVDLKILLNDFIQIILLSHVQWCIIYQNKAPQNICLNKSPPLLTLFIPVPVPLLPPHSPLLYSDALFLISYLYFDGSRHFSLAAPRLWECDWPLWPQSPVPEKKNKDSKITRLQFLWLKR